MTNVFTSVDDDRLREAFSALTAEDGEQHRPFRWQMRLLRRLIDADPPKAVDIPTGLGKTSVMALWLLALAEGANLPRRLVYVVDRRAVVDQATRFAKRLRRNLLDELADRLRLREGTRSLPISTLRGGFADNRDWLEDPSKPAIVVGTIDMVGSRLLFEGYGISRGMRPYHASFLGVDSLVLLDEAHLCPPFEALLRQVAVHRDGKLGPSPDASTMTPPFRLMSLSATGREARELSASVFKLEEQDREESVVLQRLTARKRLKVIELADQEKSLTDCIAKRAIELGGGETPARLLVYCNSRKDAVDVKTLIDEKCKELNVGYKSELLVGERRVYERTALETWLEKHGFLGGTKTAPHAPIFLIATSAGEVGVDLDADHMVCDLVAYERMVQRLGRVNRRGGKNRQAMIDVFAVRPQLKNNAGKAEKEKYEKDNRLFQAQIGALHQLPLGEDDRRDASPSATVELKSNHPDIVNAATSPASLHPELTRPLLDAWAMTAMKKHEGRPEVAPWLRGWEEDEEPQTSVVWRKHLPYVHTGTDTTVPPAMVAEFFRSAPIHATEKLEAGSSRVLDWLLKRAVQLGRRHETHDLTVENREIVIVLIDRAGEYAHSATLSDLQSLAAIAKNLNRIEQRQLRNRHREWKERYLPGAILIVDARVCGLRNGMLDEESEVEIAAADANEHWRKWEEDSSVEPSRPLIRFRVEGITGAEGEEGLGIPKLAGWRHMRTFETHIDEGGSVRRGLAVFKWPDDVTDEDSRSILSAPQSLSDHAAQVASRAYDLAKQLLLPPEEIEALTIAARLHDDGKAAGHWQNAMNAPKDGRLYAKTCGGGNWRLLGGYRHEFGSLLKAEREDLPDDTRDLILHLIAAHHGRARPLVSSAGCEEGPPSLLASKAEDAALRFARLQKRYGPWGLAWREAILRAADQSVSQEWSRLHGTNQDG